MAKSRSGSGGGLELAQRRHGHDLLLLDFAYQREKILLNEKTFFAKPILI